MKVYKVQRAIRIHHYERLKRKRNTFWYGYDEKLSQKHLGMVVATPHPCSKSCCGNPRKWWKELTLQEKRNLIKFNDEMREFEPS